MDRFPSNSINAVMFFQVTTIFLRNPFKLDCILKELSRTWGYENITKALKLWVRLRGTVTRNLQPCNLTMAEQPALGSLDQDSLKNPFGPLRTPWRIKKNEKTEFVLILDMRKCLMVLKNRAVRAPREHLDRFACSKCPPRFRRHRTAIFLIYGISHLTSFRWESDNRFQSS